MFTAVEIEWLRAFLETHVLKGDYTHYVAFTIDNISSSYNSEQYDFYVLVSDEEITQSGFTYTTQGNFQLVKVDSSGASSSYNHARYVVEEGTGTTVTVNEYNHIYTNVEGSVEPDLMARQLLNKELEQMNQNLYFVIAIVMIVHLLLKSFGTAFPMKMGD